MSAPYFDIFTSAEDVISNFDAPSDALEGAEILFAWYEYEDYSGAALVVFRKDGKLYEVNGGHCSCNGLEGQWEPEETSPEALEKRWFPNEEMKSALMQVVDHRTDTERANG